MPKIIFLVLVIAVFSVTTGLAKTKKIPEYIRFTLFCCPWPVPGGTTHSLLVTRYECSPIMLQSEKLGST